MVRLRTAVAGNGEMSTKDEHADAPRALHEVFWERVRGIEPPFSAWEADVLPLNYTREAKSA